MATVLKNVTKDWSDTAIVGAKDINVCAPLTQPIYYSVGAALPADISVVGMILDAGKTHPVKLAANEHLYVRLVSLNTNSQLQVAVTDA